MRRRYDAPMPKRSDPQTEQPIRPATPPPPGCLGITSPFLAMAFLLLLIAVIAGVGIFANPQGFVAGVWVEKIGQMSVPDEQKQRMVTLIFEVRDRLDAGDITQEQVNLIGQRLNEPTPAAYAVNAALFYFVAEEVQRYDLPAAHDPEAMTRQLQRLVRGVAEGTIDGQTINDLAGLVSRGGRPRPDVSAAELATLQQRAKSLADGAGVPDEPYEVDAATPFEALVRDALGDEPESESPDA